MSTESRVTCKIDYDPHVNYASEQNSIRVVKQLTVVNEGDTAIDGLCIVLSAEPEFARPWESAIPRLEPGAEYGISNCDLELSPGYFAELAEKVRGRLLVKLRTEDRLIVDDAHAIELGAYDEWSGFRTLPDLLASFVLPNHPAVERILTEAAQQLRTWNMTFGLSGYQRKDSKVPFVCCAAIYTALAKRGIHYITPPASFEAGQKIRTPDRIEATNLGTCLDLTLLIAACLEQAGIHPIVVFTQGHALVGAWLRDETFANTLIDDPQALRKRIELDDLIVFETTTLTSSPPGDFAEARAAAQAHLRDADRFEFVIDIGMARKRQILPLPIRGEIIDRELDDAALAAVVATKLDTAPDVPELEADGDAPDDDSTVAGRLERWKRKLLDLTLRNRLLNFRDTKQTVPLLCPRVDRLEDLLAANQTFRIGAKPDLFDPEVDTRNATVHADRHGVDPRDAFLLEEMQSRRLHADLTKVELDDRLLKIFRSARNGLEEGGANTLYLALGFLVWQEAKGQRTPKAPILLVPVELTRKSVQSGFRLRIADDDPLVNVTLLRKLEIEFELHIGGLDPLPEDEFGVDVNAVLRIFREAVKKISGWEVREEAWLGIFSFTKYLMWKDLQDRAELLTKSAIVDHLVHRPTEVFDAEFEDIDLRELDERYHPRSTYCVLDADSSQLAAVFAASRGTTFTLEGPPGTGKSQTITNMISQCLAEGKRVLFVSEKRAALEVVARRLQANGLGAFCLELHSNKTAKSDVLAQFRASLDAAAAYSTDEWQRRADELAYLRTTLNAYVREIHHVHENGESIYGSLSTLIDLDGIATVELGWQAPERIPRVQIEACGDAIEKLERATTAAGHPQDHPWRAAELEDWSPTLSDEVLALIADLAPKLDELGSAARAWAMRLGLDELHAGDAKAAGCSLALLEVLDEVALELPRGPGTPGGLLEATDWAALEEQIRGWIELGRSRDEYRARLYPPYTPKLIELDLDALDARWTRAQQSLFLFAWWRRRLVRRALRSVRGGFRTVQRDEVATDLANARRLRDDEARLAASSDAARLALGKVWHDGEANWTSVEDACAWAECIRRLALRAADGGLERAARVRARWADLIDEGATLTAPGGLAHDELTRFRSALGAFRTSRQELDARLALDTACAWGESTVPDHLERARGTIERFRSAIPKLRSWCHYRRARQEAQRERLLPLIEAYEAGEHAAPELLPVFRRSYAKACVVSAFQHSQVLAQFSRSEHERQIEHFRRADVEFLEYTRQYLAAKIAAEIPRSQPDANKKSELGILQRELQKKTRHMPVRKLLESIPELATRLKPCFLMSPLSVAQYLIAGEQGFDVVIFDEASQIPVWDAIGALARGKSAVIVGDPKQLPPTSFFSLSDDDDVDSGDVVEDLESILDDCLGANVPMMKLDWHYRSSHESLITFSNTHYYDNRLLTFPAPTTESVGVRFHLVPDGIYDKGKTRTNPREAECIVAEIVERLLDPERRGQSIGVVTFSKAQQSLIEDQLEFARREHPEIDPYFDTDASEPVFIKNLENVQGDERDVILFSICYARDLHGRMSMNFGPINQQGGERRLNVAITRARREVLVFASIRADAIDLARTNARGVRDLKTFLDYAERGPRAIAEATVHDSGGDPESPFEKQVRDALTSHGWQVHSHVGCSGYRIDLAVVDPRQPGRYLLGVECDGASYHSGKTARDRDRIRQSVLEGLGWRLHRIWSTEWWQDRDGEIDKLLEVLDAAISEEPQDSPPREASASSIASDVMAEGPSVEDERYASAPTATATREQTYRRHHWPESQPLDEFYEPSSTGSLTQMIADVIETEGPISENLLSHRIAEAFELKRTKRFLERLSPLLPKQGWTHSVDVRFFWPSHVDPKLYESFRRASEDRSSIDDIADEELGNAHSSVLEAQVSLPREDLIRESSRALGFGRTSQAMHDRLDRVLIELDAAGRITLTDERVSLRR